MPTPAHPTRIRLTALGALIAALVATSLFALAPRSSAAPGCPDYLFVGARGSGQDYHRDTKGDYGVGSTVFAFYQELNDDLYGTGLDIELDPVPEPPYQATGINFGVGAGAFFHLPAAYENSVRVIEPWVRQEVSSRLASCPDTKLVLSGYSQGAQGVADAMQRDINPAVVVGAAFFGDPYFNPRSPGDRGSFDPDRIGILGVRPQYGPSLAHKVFSYCRDKDPICQGFIRYTTFSHLTTWDTGQHGRYATSGDPSETDTEMAADNVAALIRADQGVDGNPIDEPAPRSLSGPLDVAFAIDSTGSMGGIIDSVKQNVADIAANLQAADPDFRVALVDYKDAEPYSDDAYQAEVDQGFTSDLGQFDSAVQGLYADGGGDAPESVYTGMMTALGLPWRPGAHKEMIVIGDAGGHPVDPITGYTATDVVSKSLSLDPVAVDAVPASQEAEETFASVAAETGGSVIPVEGEAAESVIRSIQATQTVPVATLGEEIYEGFEDEPIALSAAGSYSPLGRPLTFEWDFDDDGVTDETTTTPMTEHTFAGGYDGPVTVRVSDEKGQAAVAQATVRATGVAPPPPGTPAPPVLTPGDESVTATWSAPAPGGPVDLYQLSDAVGDPLAVVPSRLGEPQSTTVEGLPDGEPVQLTVTAINSSGTRTSGLSAAVSPGVTTSGPPASEPSGPDAGAPGTGGGSGRATGPGSATGPPVAPPHVVHKKKRRCVLKKSHGHRHRVCVKRHRHRRHRSR
jgi:hypothetical protein